MIARPACSAKAVGRDTRPVFISGDPRPTIVRDGDPYGLTENDVGGFVDSADQDATPLFAEMVGTWQHVRLGLPDRSLGVH